MLSPRCFAALWVVESIAPCDAVGLCSCDLLGRMQALLCLISPVGLHRVGNYVAGFFSGGGLGSAMMNVEAAGRLGGLLFLINFLFMGVVMQCMCCLLAPAGNIWPSGDIWCMLECNQPAFLCFSIVACLLMLTNVAGCWQTLQFLSSTVEGCGCWNRVFYWDQLQVLGRLVWKT
ncbi:hypothetical protein Nepgr_021030 [Nepenthes gracilis]|uniref:Uncharacterized protein n=1 Tax=Nepenthes gracilis TaxID=150966 RepID=A0AAD3SYT7_NEPGR|nr:hypothetical protein Nepgr_021030 [Nepenthes gracilis]